MRIAIDARSLVGSRTGVGRYLQNLLAHFTTKDENHTFYLYSHKSISDRIRHHGYHYKVLQGHPIIWKQFLLPVEQFINKYDLTFVPTYSAPALYPGKVLLTIHDMIFAKHPEWTDRMQAFRFRSIIPRTARRADCILAVSEASRRDIIELTRVPSNKVEVVYLGVEEIFRKRSHVHNELFLEKQGISYPYLLHVGSLHPRRNIKRLVDAFLFLKQTNKIEHHLILAGLDLDHKSEIISNLNHPHIHYLGYVSDEDLVGFYGNADVFIYPSLYEGFGLPVIEAMACGTPVITSNVSSLPEVAGDAALFVDPEDTETMIQAILKLTGNKNLHQELSQKGLERSRAFTWNRTSEQTLQIMENLM